MTQWGLDTLFNPAKRHMDEEKRRLQSTREEVGDSSGGKRIDLESGKVVIAKSTDEGAAEPDAADSTASTHAADEGTGESSVKAKAAAKKQAEDAKKAADELAAKLKIENDAKTAQLKELKADKLTTSKNLK